MFLEQNMRYSERDNERPDGEGLYRSLQRILLLLE